jgi:hypothetical protein
MVHEPYRPLVHRKFSDNHVGDAAEPQAVQESGCRCRAGSHLGLRLQHVEFVGLAFC